VGKLWGGRWAIKPTLTQVATGHMTAPPATVNIYDGCGRLLEVRTVPRPGTKTRDIRQENYNYRDRAAAKKRAAR
jgi:hypothetical protein